MRADVTGHAKDLRNDLLESIDSKAEQVRAMVDARIAETLKLGLDAHFGQVGDRLETVRERLDQVQQGLIEVQTFAAGVGNIQRALATVRLGSSKGRLESGNVAAPPAESRARGSRRRAKPVLAEAARDAVEAQVP
jgi:DNA anti-recombination protein RmuC